MANITGMSSPDDWNSVNVTTFLAEKLALGQLSLFLGAGVSRAVGLPDWSKLVDDIFASVSVVRPDVKDNTEDVLTILNSHFDGDRVLLARKIRTILYKNYDSDPDGLDSNKMLSALGALLMSSVRGSASHVVTFNYDDLLETYLRWRGLVVESIAHLPHIGSRSDIKVLHLHGLLPLDTSCPVNRGVVISQMDYDSIVGDAKNFWRQRVTDILRSTTPIFVGLSGQDANLTSMLTETHKLHPNASRDQYWGVRFSVNGDSNGSTWRNRGIYSMELGSYDEIPSLILNMCRHAAALRSNW